jgi:hypothetical protein
MARGRLSEPRAVDRHDQPGWQGGLKRGEGLDVLCPHLAPNAEVKEQEYGIVATKRALAGALRLPSLWRWKSPVPVWHCGVQETKSMLAV